MGIWNSAQFLVEAGKTLPGSVSQICDALNTYHSAPVDPAPALYIVYKMCGKWMENYDNRVLPQNTDEQRKYAAVARLRNDAYVELDSLTQMAFGRYDARKLAGPRDRLPKQLDAGYDLERKTYLAQKKTITPYSASKVSDLVKRRKGKLEDLSEKKFEELGKEVNVRMYFCNKVQRLKLRVDYDQTNGWVDGNGKQLNNDYDVRWGLGCFDDAMMYAMDQYGNLFADYSNEAYGEKVLGVKRVIGKVGVPEAAGFKARGGMMNHSSFCAGRAVISAGMIFFWKGQLIHIDNLSGHYKPTRENLFSAVSILVNDYYSGNCPPYLRVGVQDNGEVSLYTGVSFLRGFPKGDWPEQEQAKDHTPIYKGISSFKF